MVSGLPSGVVTLLFTDVEGSTRLLQELGDGYGEALHEHRRRLREAVRGLDRLSSARCRRMYALWSRECQRLPDTVLPGRSMALGEVLSGKPCFGGHGAMSSVGRGHKGNVWR